MSLQTRISDAFKELKSAGYFVKENMSCCSFCGWIEVPGERIDKTVFYTEQGRKSLERLGYCYLSWEGNGNEIEAVLNKHGIKTEWDGEDTSMIRVKL